MALSSVNLPSSAVFQLLSFVSQAAERPLAGVQVLLVEDELDVAELLLFMLESAGAEVVWVMRSGDALMQLSSLQPDVLVCNVKLPDYDGDQLMQVIRQTELQTTQHLPAIAVTSYTRDFGAKKMLASGFDRFLTKDFDVQQLTATILDLI